MPDKKKAKRRVGRPEVYLPETVVCLCATGASKLQAESNRRAVIQFLVDVGGKASIADINAHFKFDNTKNVGGLVRTGWLRVLNPDGTFA